MRDRTREPLENFAIADILPTDRISPNFSIHELLRSDIAARNGIRNEFSTDQQLRNAVFLCRRVLQPVRDRFGAFTPNSVFRSQEVERRLKNKPASWHSTSQHARGQAADIEVPPVTNLALAEWIENNLDYDQLILECYDPAIGPNSGWVHVSLKFDANRRQVLRYERNGVRFVYRHGLHRL